MLSAYVTGRQAAYRQAVCDLENHNLLAERRHEPALPAVWRYSRESFGRSATNVVDGVGRQRETIFAGLLLGRTLHHAEYSFHDVVHVCEVALAVAIVEDLDGLASLQLLRGGEVELIRAAGGPYTVKKRRLEIGK